MAQIQSIQSFQLYMSLPFSVVSMFPYTNGLLERFPDIAVTRTIQSVPAYNPVTFTVVLFTKSSKFGSHEQHVKQLQLTSILYLSTLPVVGGFHCIPNSVSVLKT